MGIVNAAYIGIFRVGQQLLRPARLAEPGETFAAAGQTLVRAAVTRPDPARVWADDPASGKRRDLAASPELAEVLSAIISRVRDDRGAVPLVRAYDRHECQWLGPSPFLFQRRWAAQNRAICPGVIRNMLTAALAGTELTDAAGQPLRYTPHDFRRMFITDAIMNGLPPHIAQIVAGHQDINVTLGYKAVYPDEAIQAHLAFLARRRALRPSEEYRVPTDAEWAEFLGHFERRKVATGTCGRAFSTPCIHEHVPLTELTDARIGYRCGSTDCDRRASSALSESWSSLRVAA